MAPLKGKLKMDLAFMDLLWVGRQAPALPWANCEKSMWWKYG
jgi:hypothetical protein